MKDSGGMEKSSKKEESIVYYVININEDLRIKLNMKKREFSQQQKEHDFIKYISKSADITGCITTTESEPKTQGKKIFFSTDMLELLNRLVTSEYLTGEDPEGFLRKRLTVGLSDIPDPRFSYDMGGCIDLENDPRELIL